MSLPDQNSLCRIITYNEWRTLIAYKNTLSFNTIDERDGYVHLSTISQVLETLNLYFSVDQKPLIVILDKNRIHQDLQWDIVIHRNNQRFPHLYRKLHFDDIIGIWEVQFQGTFTFGNYTKLEEYCGKVEKKMK